MSLLFKKDFAVDGLEGLYLEAGRPDSIQIQNLEALLPHELALRFNLKVYDPDVSGSRRAECVLLDDHGKPYRSEPFGEDRWYFVSFYLPDAWGSDATSKELLFQWHGKEDPGEPRRGPVLSFYTFKSLFRLERRWSAKKIQKANDAKPEILWYGSIIRNRYVNVVVHVRWAWDKTGFCELYLDGRQVYAQSGEPTAYNDDHGPYFKFGIYKPSWAHKPPLIAAGVSERTAWFGGILIGDKSTQPKELLLQ